MNSNQSRCFTVTVTLCIVCLICITVISCSGESSRLPPVTKNYCREIRRNDTVRLSQQLSTVKQFMSEKTGVYVLEDGGTAMMTRAWLCEYSEKTIDIQYFIFSTDNIGLIACDYLVRAADRGVKVRILIDDIMVEAGTKEILTMDSHENIEIRMYNPGGTGKNLIRKVKGVLKDFEKANRRMHNKTLIVDGCVAITGGRNVANEYYDYDNKFNFMDRDLLIVGKEVQAANSSFEDFWSSALSVPITELEKPDEKKYKAEDRFERLHNYACDPDNFWPGVRSKINSFHNVFSALQESGNIMWLDSVRFISDEPVRNFADSTNRQSNTTAELVHLIRNAKHSIDIQSPYLVSNDDAKKLFKDAVDRGVRVRILTNSLATTDNYAAFSGYQRDRAEWLETGIRIFEFKPYAALRNKIMTSDLKKHITYTPVFTLHSKTMVIDGMITVIGTYNIDPRSIKINTECITVIHSAEFSERLMRWIEEGFGPGNSWETTNAYNPDKEASSVRRVKAYTRKIVPKDVL